MDDEQKKEFRKFQEKTNQQLQSKIAQKQQTNLTKKQRVIKYRICDAENPEQKSGILQVKAEHSGGIKEGTRVWKNTMVRTTLVVF